MGAQPFLYGLVFPRCDPLFAAGFFLVDTFVLTAFRIVVLADDRALEPESRSSTAAPAASGRVSSPFRAFTTCSLPDAIVFDTIRAMFPILWPLFSHTGFVCWSSRRIAGNLAGFGGGIETIPPPVAVTY